MTEEEIAQDFERYGKKRKALEDELKAIELEQKRLRLTQALAEMESSD